MDSNILNGLGRWRPLLGSVEAFRKVQHFVDDSKQAIPPAQKGKETIKKHTCVESGPPRQFSVRVPPARDSVHSTGRQESQIGNLRPLRLFAIGGERYYMIRDLLIRRSHRLTKWGANASAIIRQSSRRLEPQRQLRSLPEAQ